MTWTLKRGRGKKDPLLIVRIKNNEEVQSYPKTAAQVLPFCRIKDSSQKQKLLWCKLHRF